MQVLFLSHEATRTGAPLLLLHLLQWLGRHSDLSFEAVVERDGEISEDFQSLCPTHIAYAGPPLSTRPLVRVTAGITRELRAWRGLREVRRALLGRSFDLVYANTAMCGRLLKVLNPEVPVLTHVHELYGAISRRGLANWKQVSQRTSSFVAVSWAAKEDLIRRNVPADRVHVVPAFLPEDFAPHRAEDRDRAAVLRSISARPGSLLIGACGAVSRLKGADLFVRLAEEVLARFPQRPVHFLWVGPTQDGRLRRELVDRVQDGTARGRVHFVGPAVDPRRFFAHFDVLAMVSREESFGLVTLECAAHRVPIVSFAESRGPQEFVGADAGLIVPSLSPEAMAEAIVRLLHHPELRRSIGESGAAKAAQHFGAHRCAKRILEIMVTTAKRRD